MENTKNYKRKTIDEKIQELKEKLKDAEQKKKNDFQKKTIKIWRKIKYCFTSNPEIVEILVNDKEKMDELSIEITLLLTKLYPEKFMDKGEIYESEK